MKTLFILTIAFFYNIATSAGVMEKIKKRGFLRCGIDGSLKGFSEKKGDTYHGFDVDFCKAVAAAINVKAIKYIELTSKERLQALLNKKIDILSRTTTWTLGRDVKGLTFIGTIYYDGEGFLVKGNKVSKIEDLENKTFCILAGTTSSDNIATSYHSKFDYKIKEYDTLGKYLAAFKSNDCNILVYDRSALSAIKRSLPTSDGYSILDQIISKEPLSPVVRDDDSQWIDICRWSLFALIHGEEVGVGLFNINSSLFNTKQLKFLSGGDFSVYSHMNVDHNWVRRIISTVGNYGEIFHRNLGEKSGLKLKRSLNKIWTNGGLLYSPPFK